MNQKTTVGYSQTLPNQSTLLARMGNTENALCTALHHVRNCKTIADLQRATARASRAVALLKQASETTSLPLGV